MTDSFSHLLFCFVLSSSVVQLSSFNFTHLFCVSLSIISLLYGLVNRFLKFFSNFFDEILDVIFCSRFCDSFIILSPCLLFVKCFLKKIVICYIFSNTYLFLTLFRRFIQFSLLNFGYLFQKSHILRHLKQIAPYVPFSEV